jgi:hypothetical protein
MTRAVSFADRPTNHERAVPVAHHLVRCTYTSRTMQISFERSSKSCKVCGDGEPRVARIASALFAQRSAHADAMCFQSSGACKFGKPNTPGRGSAVPPQAYRTGRPPRGPALAANNWQRTILRVLRASIGRQQSQLKWYLSEQRKPQSVLRGCPTPKPMDEIWNRHLAF